MKPSLKKGFSIIELIFVIAVIGILAAVAVPKLLDTRTSAVVNTVKQDISTITNAIQSHYMLNNTITDIRESVNVNESTWDVKNDTATFPAGGTPCVTITVNGTQLKVDIADSVEDDSGNICNKLHDAGVKDVSYELL